MADMKFFTDGNAYERMMGRWSRRVGEDFLDWMAVPPGARWLDVGCGNGAFTETIIARCAPAEITGVDPSEAQLAYAAAQKAATGARFRAGNAEALPFDDNTFDAAAMGLVIAFIPDPAKAAAEMARVVRPGGWAGNYMWDLPGNGVPTGQFRRAALALGWPEIPHPPKAEVARIERMQALWEAAGFSEVETRRIEIEVSFADFDDFWQSNTALPNQAVQFLRGLSEADIGRVRDWLRAALPPDDAGRIRYPSYAHAVKGRVPA